ncbi:MAG: hypothetical protein ABII23_07735 [bacterium]
MGRKTVAWQDTDAVLGLFGDTINKARSAYREYISEGNAGSGDF